MRVHVFNLRASAIAFRAKVSGFRNLVRGERVERGTVDFRVKSQHARKRQGSGSSDPGSGFRAWGVSWVSDLGFQVSGFGFRISGFGFRMHPSFSWVSGFGFLVSGVGYRVSGYGCTHRSHGSRVPGFGERIQGFRCRDPDT